MKSRIAILVIAFLFALPAFSLEAKGRIVVLKISGSINPVVSEFLTQGIENANSEKEELIVLQMDTPGGLDTSMRDIIKSIQNSSIPVATFVSPAGSRAASAGTFITISSHIAAMAPGTNIGAAHPVNLMGGNEEGQDSPMKDKVLNDSSAYIRSLAEMRQRNAHWAELAVRKSVSISAKEAKKLAVIDLVASDIEALVLAVDGREFDIQSKKIQLETQDRPIVYFEMNQRQKILDIISTPNVAYILMMMGLVGLYFELSNPGLILPGVIGGVSMILALYSMQTLPVNYAGLLLILLGLILFIAELNLMSYGLLSVGGAVSLFLGSIMLIDSEDPAMQISRSVLYPTLGFSLMVTGGIMYMAIKSGQRKPVSGIEGMIGEKGTVKTELSPEGSVLLHGEVWRAQSDEPLSIGQTIVVEAVDGLQVKVKKAQKE